MKLKTHPSNPASYAITDTGYETPCWIYQRHLDSEGYANPRVDGRMVKGHRVTYEAKFGCIPEGLELDHLCRTRACVNPDHLEPVTRAENVRRGALAKLTHEQVVEIKRHMRVPAVRWAERFGVTPDAVRKVKQGKNWRDVTP